MKHEQLIAYYSGFFIEEWRPNGICDNDCVHDWKVEDERRKGKRQSKYHLKNVFDGKKPKNIQQHLVQMLEIFMKHFLTKSCKEYYNT